MARSPWTLQQDELRRQRRTRSWRKARAEAPPVIVAFLFGALAVGYYLVRPDLTAFLSSPAPTVVSAQRPTSTYPHFGMCRSSLDRDCVVDGDTFRLGTEKMRIANIDAPETHSNVCGGAREVDLGKRAAARLQTLMNGGALDVQRGGEDRYGRTLVRVRAGPRDVGEALIAERLARRWPDGEEWWCR